MNLGQRPQQFDRLGFYVSTVLRVINRAGNQRNSRVFLTAPDYETNIDCIPSCLENGEAPKHAPLTSGEYIVSGYEEVLI